MLLLVRGVAEGRAVATGREKLKVAMPSNVCYFCNSDPTPAVDLCSYSQPSSSAAKRLGCSIAFFSIFRVNCMQGLHGSDSSLLAAGSHDISGDSGNSRRHGQCCQRPARALSPARLYSLGCPGLSGSANCNIGSSAGSGPACDDVISLDSASGTHKASQDIVIMSQQSLNSNAATTQVLQEVCNTLYGALSMHALVETLYCKF